MNFKRPLILASSSPRRQFLMKEVGFDFTVLSPDIDESFSGEMALEEVPSYLAEKKARVFDSRITDEVVLAADTVVILENEILNKPVNRADAIRMLTMLSGKTHQVITAVCLFSKTKVDTFDDRTQVTFRNITRDEIEFYVDHFRPLDKAGAYGAQDCLPAGFNPCSQEEINFLIRIDKPRLMENTIHPPRSGNNVVIIEKIRGSYFTVMGLPIHKVYPRLTE